jgi:hypothetical protein
MAKSKRVPKETLMRLHNEIKLAEARNEAELLPVINENIARYTGKHIPVVGRNWDIILNEVYPIVQFNIPSIHFRNPKAFLKPKNKNFIAKRRNPQTGDMDEVTLDSGKSARTQEALLNYTIDEIGYKKELRKTLFDALLAPHGVLWHGYKGEFGMTEEQSLTIKDERIFVKRLSPLRFLFDPAVNISNLDEARWIGRSFDIPLTELLEDERLNVDKDKLKGKLGFGQGFMVDEKGNFVQSNATDKLPNTSRVKPLLEFADKDFRDSKNVRFVTMYEIQLRPTKKEKRDGKKGDIILLTDEQFQDLRNNPNPYKYDDWMAKILQFNPLPDATFGLDDVSTYKSIADNKNIMRNLQIRNAQENSKVWVFLAKDGTSEEDIEKVRVGDQTILTFEGDSVQGRAQVSSAGLAASQELYLIDGRLDKELMDKSFVSDQKKGFLQSGEESAANAKIRAAGGAVRPAFRQDMMVDFLKDSYGAILAMLKQFMPVKDAVRIVGSLDLEWSDNFTKSEIQAPTDVDIDAISLQPSNPDKEVQELNIILNLMTSALNNPALERKLLSEKKTFNIAPIINQLLMRLRVIDPEIFRNIRPEEEMGFVSVAELQAAQANVVAAIQDQPIPSPPEPGQDHKARIEMYTAIMNLLESLGLQADKLAKLIEQQTLIFEEETKVKSPRVGQKISAAANKKQEQGAGA